MATITGTQGEKVDQVTQLFLSQQAQIRVLQWLMGIFIPVLILFASWLGVTVNSTKLDNVAFQGKIELVNQRIDQMDKRIDQLDTRMGQMEKRMDQIEKILVKIEAKLEKLDKIEEHLNKLEKPKP